MPFDENEYDRLKAWDEEPADPEPDGDADDVDTAGVEAAASVGGQPMELPEMDFTEHAMTLPEMDFSTPAVGGDEKAHFREMASQQMEPPRLRAPTKTAAEPPPAASMAKASLGVMPPDWKSIGQRLGLAGIGKADSRNYESLFANAGNVGAYRPNPHAGEVLTDTARLPVDLAKEQQGYESRDMALQGQKSKIAQTAAERDPNSLQSQKARNAIKAMGLKLPEGFEEWSAADVKQFTDTGALTRLEATRAKTAGDQAKAEKADAELQAMRKTWTPELKAAGKDPNTATKFDVQQVQAAKRAAATEKLANSNYALAAKRDERTAGEHDALGSDVPFAGKQLKYRGKGTPREDDRREVQKVSSLYGAAIAGMDDLGEALDRFARNPSPETKDDVSSKARVVSGHLNTAAGQGAMAKEEADAMSAALGTDVLSPTGLQALAQKIMGDDPKAAAILTRKLKSVRETARNSAMGKIRAYNYDADAPAEKIRVRNKKTGATGSLSPQFFDPEKYEKIQ